MLARLIIRRYSEIHYDAKGACAGLKRAADDVRRQCDQYAGGRKYTVYDDGGFFNRPDMKNNRSDPGADKARTTEPGDGWPGPVPVKE